MTDSLSDQPSPTNERGFLAGALEFVAVTMWGYRRVVLLALLIVATAHTVIGGYMFLSQPVVHSASLPFRPVFSSASIGRYPSGLGYSESDVISSTVLSAVFEKNQLSHYLDFQTFSNSVTVLQSGNGRELLQLEYAAKLSDPRLTQIERTKLESEFDSKLQTVPLEYTLTLVSPPSGWKLPPIVAEKTLTDILQTWATQAVELRGATSYQLSLVSANSLGLDDASNTDYVRRADTIRGKLHRLAQAIELLEKLPGGLVMRGGEKNLTLPELRSRIEDLLKYEVEPLFGQIAQSGLVADSASALRYLREQLARAERDAQDAEGRRRAISDAFRTYVNDGAEQAKNSLGSATAKSDSGVTPQLSESFLDRIIALGGRQTDVAYRQAIVSRMEAEALKKVTMDREVEFYKGAIVAVQTGAGRNASEAARKSMTDSIDRVFKTAFDTATQANQLYASLSAHNLNPQTQLYAVTGGLRYQSQRPMSFQTLVLFGLIELLATFVIAVGACLVHYFFTREILARRARKAPTAMA
jgi:hypothetical protein